MDGQPNNSGPAEQLFHDNDQMHQQTARPNHVQTSGNAALLGADTELWSSGIHPQNKNKSHIRQEGSIIPQPNQSLPTGFYPMGNLQTRPHTATQMPIPEQLANSHVLQAQSQPVVAYQPIVLPSTLPINGTGTRIDNNATFIAQGHPQMKSMMLNQLSYQTQSQHAPLGDPLPPQTSNQNINMQGLQLKNQQDQGIQCSGFSNESMTGSTSNDFSQALLKHASLLQGEVLFYDPKKLGESYV